MKLVPMLAELQVALARLTAAVLARPAHARRGAVPLADVRRIMVIRVDEIGDAVIATTFLRELRRAAPHAHISAVVQPSVARLLHACPFVDELIAYDVACRRALRPFVLPVRALRFAIARLQPLRPDLVILPRWDADQAYATMLARFTAAPWRVGYSHRVRGYKRHINAGFDGLLTHVLDERGVVHEVERSLALLRWLGVRDAAGGPELTWSAEDATAAAALLPFTDGEAPRRWIAICPSFGHSHLKQWPAEHFAELARRLAARGDVRIAIVGSPADRPLAAPIVRAVGDRAVDLTGATTLGQLPALLARCALLVAADTGVMHAAAAVGTPVVGLFGPTNVVRFAPWGEDVVSLDLPCSPVHRMPEEDRCPTCVLGSPRCMLDMAPDVVYDAVARRLDGARPVDAAGGARPQLFDHAARSARELSGTRDALRVAGQSG